ncbi:MAG: sigma-54 dependent transcriptional regulator [Polyangiales bacterium]
MAKVLVVDDEAGVRFTLAEVLGEKGHAVVEAASGREALSLAEGCDVVLTDLSMPEMDGLALLAALKRARPALPVVMLTARGSERAAVAAMKAGAHDYLTKPFDIDEVSAAVERAAELSTLRARDRWSDVERALGRPVVGSSPALKRVLDAAVRVADREVPVLVTGESGTGKELLASVLHAAGRRAKGPLVRFNCAALPESLAEAELFGHARGAFTGAAGERKGWFAQAQGGTLVLDEVGELPLALQAKLLRATQDGEIQPVGAARVERVDVRVVASTHRDLAEEARRGRFREDLYYRLSVVTLRMPALRERPEDIPSLARHFAARYAERFGLPTARVSPALESALAARPWPGNVRELENCVAGMMALSDDGALDARDLAPSAARDEHAEGLRARVAAFERGLIAEALAASEGNQSEAARRLGIPRGSLIERLKRYGLG